MASNEAVLVENAVSKLHYLQFITTGIIIFLSEHFQQVQFHWKPNAKSMHQNQDYPRRNTFSNRGRRISFNGKSLVTKRFRKIH